MDITKITITLATNRISCLAWCEIELNHMLTIKQIEIVQGVDNIHVEYPLCIDFTQQEKTITSRILATFVLKQCI